MNDSKILEMAIQFGLSPTRSSATQYHSPCPRCGGKDRFILWVSTERYWCRQCEAYGDAIQFCRDFLGLSYVEACARVGQPLQHKIQRTPQRSSFKPLASAMPTDQWMQGALAFVRETHARALSEPRALALLIERGFSLETIRKFLLGWNDRDLFEELDHWGLAREEKRKVWLPMGLVIPTFCQDHLIKLKIRRAVWHPGDTLPKYAEIIGSRKAPSLFGDCRKALVLLESELDAILLQQITGDLCSCMAIGGVKRKPDLEAHQLLSSCSCVLFSLDYDEPGKGAYIFWKKLYPHLKPWPAPLAKSIGDAFKVGVDLRRWIQAGIRK